MIFIFLGFLFQIFFNVICLLLINYYIMKLIIDIVMNLIP